MIKTPPAHAFRPYSRHPADCTHPRYEKIFRRTPRHLTGPIRHVADRCTACGLVRPVLTSYGKPVRRRDPLLLFGLVLIATALLVVACWLLPLFR